MNHRQGLHICMMLNCRRVPATCPIRLRTDAMNADPTMRYVHQVEENHPPSRETTTMILENKMLLIKNVMSISTNN